MTVINTDPAGYLAALKAATAGDVILLADGVYPAATITGDYPLAPLTLMPQNAGKARLGKVALSGATNVTLSGLALDGGAVVDRGSAAVTFAGCTVAGAISARDVARLTVVGCTIDGTQFGIVLRDVRGFTIRDCLLHTAVEDLLRITGDSFDGLVENNTFRDTLPVDNRAIGKGYTHSDMIQFFALTGKTPHDIVIRGNHLWDDPTTGAPTVTPQGIFVSDPAAGGYRNILIEDNLICVRSQNSIYINGGQHNVVVRNNTLMPGLQDGGAVIRLAKKAGFDNGGTTVTGNVMKLLADETARSTTGYNYVYGRGADMASLFQGDGSQPAHFVPPAGSPIGAQFGAWIGGFPGP